MPKYFSIFENEFKNFDKDTIVYLVRVEKNYGLKAMQNNEITKCNCDPETRQLYGLKIVNPQNFSEFFEDELLKSCAFSAKQLVEMQFHFYDLQIMYFNLSQRNNQQSIIEEIKGIVDFPFYNVGQLGMFVSRFPGSREQIIWDLFDNTYNRLANECLTRILQNLSSPKQLGELLDVIPEKEIVIIERVFGNCSTDKDLKNRLFADINIPFKKLRQINVTLLKKILLSPQLIKKFSQIDISLNDLLMYDLESLQDLLDHVSSISTFIRCGFTWEYFLELADRKTLLDDMYYLQPEKLTQGHSLLSAPFLMTLKAPILYLLLKKTWGSDHEPLILSFVEHSFPVEKLQTIHPDLLKDLLGSPHGILTFIKSGFKWEYFLELADRKTLLDDMDYLQPEKLTQGHSLLSAPFLMTLKAPILYLLLKKTWGSDHEPLILSFVEHSFPVEKLQTIHPDLLKDLLGSPHGISTFIKSGFKWEYFLELADRKTLLDDMDYLQPEKLTQGHSLLSAPFLMTLKAPILYLLLKKTWGSDHEPLILSFVEHGFPVEKLQTIHPDLLKDLLGSPHGISTFIKSGFKWEYFLELADRKTLLDDMDYLQPEKLTQGHSLLSAPFLMTLKAPILYLLLKKTWGSDHEPLILSFVEHGFPVEKLQTIHPDLLKDLLGRGNKILEFISYGFIWEYLFELNNEMNFFDVIYQLLSKNPTCHSSFRFSHDLLSKYSKVNFSTNFFHDKSHANEVLEIVKKIDKNEIVDMPQLLNLLEQIQPKNTVNDLSRCILFIKKAFNRESESMVIPPKNN